MPLRVAHITTIDLSLKFLLLDQMKALQASGYELTGISAPGPWVAHLEDAGIRHIPWTSSSRSWGVRGDAHAFAELAAILRRERFDLVHTHNTKPGILGRMLARSVGVPAVVNTVHGLYASPVDRPAKKLPVLALERLAVFASDLELYQSEEDLQWARRIGLLGNTRGVLIGNGIDLERFDPSQVPAARRIEVRRQLGIPEQALVVGTVARMVAKKGIREFFAVARRLREEYPDVRFVAVGGVDPQKSDALMAGELEAARDDVIITGWQADARDLTASMDVFVLASWWGEGKPRSAMEAAALGKPLVVTDVRGCREVVSDRVQGFVVPPRDAGALAAGVQKLLDDPELRITYGEAARRRALTEFDQRRVFELVVEEYRSLAARKGLTGGNGSRQAVLRRARRSDSDTLARLHAEGLPDGFLTTLGTTVLSRLYRAMVDDGGCVCLVAELGGTVAGFASGTVSMGAFKRRFILRQGIPVSIAVARGLLLRPGVLRGIVEDLRYGGDAPGSDASRLPGAEVMSLAIAPEFRSRGLARQLMAGVVTDLGKLGATEARLLVAPQNREANRLYPAMGFEPAGTITLHRGVKSNIWRARCRS
jgi:glycosyltransferase involved in cell wall biosynthesis/ribosomal protein S18 acetylase RimI-like enzyme